MSPTGPDKYREWTGAYVLGALSATERREFDKHLEVCADCAASVAECSGLPAMLALLTRDQALALGQTAEPERPSQTRHAGGQNPGAPAPKETPSPKDQRDD
jgi:anti-sigma factor RsiW